jgi:hypothetical protein
MYIYAFLETPDAKLDLPPGIVSALELISCDRLSVVVEAELLPDAIRAADEAFQLQAILSHDRVLRDLFSHQDLLPVPFGTFLRSRPALAEYLQTHQTEFLEKLDAVRGKAEYTLKLIPAELPLPETPDPAALKGKDYFLAKKQRYEAQTIAQQQQAEQHQQLLLSIEQLYPMVQAGIKDGVERIFLLGDRQAEATLLSHVQSWRDRCPLWDISISEALPAYHFV